MLRSGRWLFAAAGLLAASALSSPSRAQAPATSAHTEAELAAARQLFAQALHDEQEKRFDAALDGFRRVRDVRDTAPVEYRIATCLEGLGRLADALATYDAAIRLTEGDPAAADVATGSRERIDALSKRVAHLQLALSAHAPPDAELRVDGRPQPSGDIVLDPGSHRVEATATGAPPFRSDVALPEGGRISLTVPLDPSAPPPSAPPRAPDEVPTRTGQGSTTAMWGWLGIGAGSAFLVAGVTSLILRESDIRTANRDCPGGGCVGSIDGDALSATNRARIEGPLGFGLGAAGVVAAGLGVYLVARAPGRAAAALSFVPTAFRDGGGLVLRGAL